MEWVYAIGLVVLVSLVVWGLHAYSQAKERKRMADLGIAYLKRREAMKKFKVISGGRE